jgi:hypothetical protein
LGTPWELYWNVLGFDKNTLRTSWEHSKNRLKTKNSNPSPLAPTQNPKEQIQALLSVIIGCMKFLFPAPISARTLKQIIKLGDLKCY